MYAKLGTREGQLGAEVAIRDGVQAVARGYGEAEAIAGLFAIDGQRGGSQRTRTQRTLGGATSGIEKAAAIAAEHFRVGQQMVTESNGLRALQVCVPGQKRRGMLARSAADRHAGLVDGHDDGGCR